MIKDKFIESSGHWTRFFDDRMMVAINYSSDEDSLNKMFCDKNRWERVSLRGRRGVRGKNNKLKWMCYAVKI